MRPGLSDDEFVLFKASVLEFLDAGKDKDAVAMFFSCAGLFSEVVALFRGVVVLGLEEEGAVEKWPDDFRVSVD